MRVIVHTGKGGVGKTSISAATALRCAEMGLKTIVVSTDTAHSLGDALDRQVGPEPSEIAPNLWAQELDTRYSMQKYWGRIQEYLGAFFNREGIAKVNASEVTIIPGLEEGAQLLWISEYFQAREYDVLIVDAAPTAETIRLLSLPDVTRWWVERLMRIARGLDSVIRPVQKLLTRAKKNETGIDIAENAWDQVQLLFDTLDGVRELLTDPEHSSIRLVVNPERMVIRETQRTYTYLNLYDYATDAILVNRVFPDEIEDPFFDVWKQRQARNIEFVGEAFGSLPVLKAPLFGEEMGGLDMLRRLADELYGDRNPAERMFDGVVHKLVQLDSESTWMLRVPVGFASKEQLELYRARDELTLSVGPYRRNIVLPDELQDLEITSAKFENRTLNIRFEAQAS
ncbi:MAG: ArsA family ATPase [Chloroflexota bacterium]|nr:ArsA family ATPase [Chloroflexota bacterium]